MGPTRATLSRTASPRARLRVTNAPSFVTQKLQRRHLAAYGATGSTARPVFPRRIRASSTRCAILGGWRRVSFRRRALPGCRKQLRSTRGFCTTSTYGTGSQPHIATVITRLSKSSKVQTRGALRRSTASMGPPAPVPFSPRPWRTSGSMTPPQMPRSTTLKFFDGKSGIVARHRRGTTCNTTPVWLLPSERAALASTATVYTAPATALVYGSCQLRTRPASGSMQEFGGSQHCPPTVMGPAIPCQEVRALLANQCPPCQFLCPSWRLSRSRTPSERRRRLRYPPKCRHYGRQCCLERTRAMEGSSSVASSTISWLLTVLAPYASTATPSWLGGTPLSTSSASSQSPQPRCWDKHGTCCP
mmetsp:Transcript_27503/g.72284  ORF Transcript_27503/g.72284 Transcript_27503/m.72284 type:complete len:360 (+) Transcript_27503:449-1528(+)